MTDRFVLNARNALLFALCAGLPSCSHSPTPVWRAALVPCTPQLCGGVANNLGTLRLRAGEVRVEPGGLVRIRLQGLKVAANGETAANKTLEVWVGSFNSRGFEGGPVNPVGTISVGQSGDYDGTVRTSQGAPFAFRPGTSISTQFALNEPGVRTEFVTGLIVP